MRAILPESSCTVAQLLRGGLARQAQVSLSSSLIDFVLIEAIWPLSRIVPVMMSAN